MGKYGMTVMAGSRKMTPRQFANAIAKQIGGATANVELEVEKISSKYAIRSLLQIAAIIFQRIVSRTPMDEKYQYVSKAKYKELTNTFDGGEGIDTSLAMVTHNPDASVARYDWTMTIKGENEKTFSCRDFVNMDATFGMEFNSKKDIKMVLEVLINSGLIPKMVTTIKGESRPDFQISFENLNPHFKTIEYGKYRKGPTEPKQGEHYTHGVDENNFTYQAPRGFYAITMKEYEAFIATHHADVWRTMAQKMMRQHVEKVFSDKKFEQIMSAINPQTSSMNVAKSFDEGRDDEIKKNEKKVKQEAVEELKKEPVVPEDEMIRQNVFEIWVQRQFTDKKSWRQLKGEDKALFDKDVKTFKATGHI